MNIKIIDLLKKRIVVRNFTIEIQKKYQKLKVKRPLSKEQKKSIQSYYKPLVGHKVPTIWHQFMYSRTGVFAIDYMPLSLYRTELIGRMNQFPFMEAYADKNISYTLFPHVKQPKLIIKNMNGYFYTQDKAITREEAIALCENLDNAIIKPSMSTRGQGVQALNIHNGISDTDHKSIHQIFDDYQQNFLVQERIQQHPALEALNPTSANTIRLLSYRNGMDIIILYTVIRIGKLNQVIDNESAGGISARINADGTLAKYAYGAPGNDMVTHTDTGIELNGYAIPSYQKVIETVKELHYQLPYFDIAAWDFAVDVNGDPVFIEWNANPDLSQTANGPAFGEYTRPILSTIYQKPNTRNPHW